MRAARVRAYAKLNLVLEVLARRADGYHDLRTVFQTISVADVLELQAERARVTRVVVEADVDIPGENLVTRTVHSVLEHLKLRADVRCRLRKRIPMGAGMGGGSSDAAAVLRALPPLLDRRLRHDELLPAAAALGSDVPFFLLGGTAVGLGRGTELYPLPDLPRQPVLVLAPPVHVSTADAYRTLQRTADYHADENRTARVAAAMAAGASWVEHSVNDFEEPVFALHPELPKLRRKLAKSGAQLSMMTGSGSAVFGVYGDAATRDRAMALFAGLRVFRASLVPRRMLR